MFFHAVNPYVLNTLLILIDRHREGHIIQMVDHFIQLANDERGIAEAKVTSTRPLTEDRERSTFFNICR